MATVRGVPIRLHITFLLLVGFLLWRYNDHQRAKIAAIELVLVLFVLGCVVLHELGHALVAQRCEIPIEDITLYPFGGLARMGKHPEPWQVELKIAAAGPAVNLGIAVLLLAASLGQVLSPEQSVPMRLLTLLMWANLLVAGFNLLPAFPLDGGRILRSALSSRLGWIRATIWAASIGQIAGFLLVGFGVLYELWWLLLAGLLLLPGANSELRWALTLRSLSESTVADIMVSRLHRVEGSTLIAEIRSRPRKLLPSEVVVSEGEQVLGYLPGARLRSGAADRPVAELMLPVAGVLEPDTQIPAALAHLREADSLAAPVVARNGELLGIVTLASLERTQSLLQRLAPHSRDRQLLVDS